MVVQFLFQAVQQHGAIAIHPLFAFIGRDTATKEVWKSVDEITTTTCLSAVVTSVIFSDSNSECGHDGQV